MVKLEDFKVGEIKKMVSKYNKQVKIGPISKLNKSQLIEHIRKHPKLTVQENEKGVRISVKGEVNIGDKKIKIKKEEPKEEPKEKSEYIKKYEEANATPKKDNKRKRISKPINYDKPAKDVNIMEGKTDKPKSKAIEISKQLKKVKKEKPKIPSITVTEEDKPKKKVIKVGGKYITVKPKEVKADKMDIPKSKAKIRVAPKKEEKKDEELEDLSKFKKSEKVEERTIEQIKKNIKYQKKQGNDAVVKSLEKELKEKEEAKKEESSEEDEPDEISYKDFKLIKEVPKNIKKIWFDYIDDRTGYASELNQKEELEELERIENNYIEAESNRKNKSLSAKKQLKAVKTIGDILIETREDINKNADLKKIYKLFTPVILKRVLDQKKKDEADLKKEEEDIKKQQKADEKEQSKANKKK